MERDGLEEGCVELLARARVLAMQAVGIHPPSCGDVSNGKPVFKSSTQQLETALSLGPFELGLRLVDATRVLHDLLREAAIEDVCQALLTTGHLVEKRRCRRYAAVVAPPRGFVLEGHHATDPDQVDPKAPGVLRGSAIERTVLGDATQEDLLDAIVDVHLESRRTPTGLEEGAHHRGLALGEFMPSITFVVARGVNQSPAGQASHLEHGIRGWVRVHATGVQVAGKREH